MISRFTSVALLFVPIVSCRTEGPAPAHRPRPVRYEVVSSTAGGRVRTFSGRAQAGVESSLSFRVSGNVQRILVETGDTVGAGQILAELDPTDFELRVQEAEAALLQAEAQARNAESSYERVRGLYENRNASKQDLDAARAQAESARAQIDAARQRREQARAQLSYTRLRARADGAIASVDVELNENVQGGQRVALLTSGSRPQVQVAVPESLISQVRRGSEVVVSLDALPGRHFPARVIEVGVAATGLATTFPVTVELTGEAPEVRSGMAADVAFTFGEGDEQPRWFVPPHAVLEDRNGRFVYVVEPTAEGRGRVHRRTVRVGELTGNGLEIRDGLEDGDRVVVAGVSQIEDGLEVRLTEAGRKDAS